MAKTKKEKKGFLFFDDLKEEYFHSTVREFGAINNTKLLNTQVAKLKKKEVARLMSSFSVIGFEDCYGDFNIKLEELDYDGDTDSYVGVVKTTARYDDIVECISEKYSVIFSHCYSDSKNNVINFIEDICHDMVSNLEKDYYGFIETHKK